LRKPSARPFDLISHGAIFKRSGLDHGAGISPGGIALFMSLYLLMSISS
jgi:hypothetical protein